MSYSVLKVIHIVGVVLFVGNIIVSAVWKVMADKTRDLAVIRYATRLILVTDIVFTLGGIVLLLGAGHAMAPAHGGAMSVYWMRTSYLLFIATGLIWATVLLPVQTMQMRMLKPLKPHDLIPVRYWTLSRIWVVAGTLATLLPLPAIYLMTVKPLA